MDIELVRTFAAEFRSRLEEGRGRLPEGLRSFPAGCCGPVSEVLAYALERHLGHAATYVCASRYGERGLEMTHAWLEVGALIIDVTADQFSGMAPVIVTEDRAWHDAWPEHERRSSIMPETDAMWWGLTGWPLYFVGSGSKPG